MLLYNFHECTFNNDLVEKLVSSLELWIKFDERFKVTSVPFSIRDFSLLSCELDNFTFNILYILYTYYYILLYICYIFIIVIYNILVKWK